MMEDKRELETKEEKELLNKINEALHSMEKEEEKYYSYLKAPEYHRPGYQVWWVVAPLGLILSILLIIYLLPSSYPSLQQIDTQIYSVQEELQLLEPSTEKTVNLDREIEDVQKTINLLQEEENG